jgi:hypothetical protein
MNHDVKLQTKSSLSKPDQQPLRLVYIAGVARSGTTVLDNVLGNHPLIQSVGELARLPSDAWLQNFEHYCACGERSKNCPFWVAVQQAWCNSNGNIAIPKYIELQNKVEKFRQWPLLLCQSWQSTRTFQAYAEQTVLLLKAIQMVSGCAIIVDSSKGLERALALSLIPDIDMKIIQLVRDPRGVVWSHKKAFTKDLKHGLPRDIRSQPAWRATLYWCRMNLQTDWLRRRVGPEKSMLVRYEDFMLQTLPVLQKIGNFIGVDLLSVQQAIKQEEKLHFGHTIAGNRVRMQGELRLRFDQDWLRHLSPRDRRVTEIMSGWLMARYGYKP